MFNLQQKSLKTIQAFAIIFIGYINLVATPVQAFDSINQLYKIVYFSDTLQLSDSDYRKSFYLVLSKISGESYQQIEKQFNKIKISKIKSAIISSNNNLNQNNPYWLLDYDSQKINQLLKTKNISIWGAPRPKILLLIKSQITGQANKLITGNDLPIKLSQVINRIAINRGVESIISNHTEDNLKQITEQSEEYNNISELISSYYQTLYLLTIQIKKNAIVNRIDWQLKYKEIFLDSGQIFSSYSSPSLSEIINQTVTSIKQFEDEKLNKTKQFTLYFNQIETYEDFQTIIQKLQNSRWYKELFVKEINNKKVIVDLTLKGDGIDYFATLNQQGFIAREIPLIESQQLHNKVEIKYQSTQ